MRAAELLGRLDGARKTARGWTARCPAHEDRFPSLSVSDGERGVLVHCWAGCQLDAICASLGIRPSDLFYSAPTRHGSSREPVRRLLSPREFLVACEDGVWRGAMAHELRGLAVLDRAKGLDTTAWSADDFDRAMRAVCRGREDLRVAQHLHRLAFAFRVYLREVADGRQHRAA